MAAVMLRPRTDADVPACLDALRATHDADGYPAVWPSDPVRWLTAPKGAPVGVAAWVAIADGALVGHVGLARADDPVGTRAIIVRLFVHPGYRDRGIGAALMNSAVEQARRNRWRPRLEVIDSGTTAIRLYERLGWQRVGERRAEWREADGRHPMVFEYVMAKR